MNAADLAFACYWASSELRRDFDILVRCGHIARLASAAGLDNPATWFATAAQSYPACDATSAMARQACALVAASLSVGRPS